MTMSSGGGGGEAAAGVDGQAELMAQLRTFLEGVWESLISQNWKSKVLWEVNTEPMVHR